jgi:hypothetical protein
MAKDSIVTSLRSGNHPVELRLARSPVHDDSSLTPGRFGHPTEECAVAMFPSAGEISCSSTFPSGKFHSTVCPQSGPSEPVLFVSTDVNYITSASDSYSQALAFNFHVL